MVFTPTETEIQTQIANAFKQSDEMRLYAGINAENFFDHRRDLLSSLETEFGDDVRNAEAALRANLSSAYEGHVGVSAPLILEYGRFLNEPSTDLAVLFGRIYRNFIDNTLRVTSRSFTFGPPVAGGGNVGNGVLHRLNVDPEGFDIENQTADAKLVRCLVDAFSGSVEHQEQFRIEGETAERDRLLIRGSGRADTLQALSGADSANFLSNPSFSAFSGTSITALTAVTDWTPITGPIANFELTETASEIYRTFLGEGATPRALVIKASDGLRQDLGLVRRPTFTPAIPLFAQVSVNASARVAVGGSVVFRVGASSVSVTIASLAAGFNQVLIPLGTASWFDNFNANPLRVEVEWTGRISGELVVDDIVMAEYTNFDGGWYALVGGSVPFRRDDIFSFADTELGSILQFFFYLFFQAYLPHTTGGGVTWPEPT